MLGIAYSITLMMIADLNSGAFIALSKIVRFLLAMSLVWAVPDRSQAEAELLGSFGYWSAFQYESDCWVAAEPVKLNIQQMATLVTDDDFNLMIALKFGSDIPNLQIWLSDVFNTSLLAYAHIGGKKHELIYHNEGLWLKLEDELPVIKQLLAVADIRLGLFVLGSDEITAEYSSEGLREAYNHLARNCETE